MFTNVPCTVNSHIHINNRVLEFRRKASSLCDTPVSSGTVGRPPHSFLDWRSIAHLCTFSMAATSASAARLKNADTAGMSGVLLRGSSTVLCEQLSPQYVPGTLGRLLCSCSFGLSSETKEIHHRRLLQRRILGKHCARQCGGLFVLPMSVCYLQVARIRQSLFPNGNCRLYPKPHWGEGMLYSQRTGSGLG